MFKWSHRRYHYISASDDGEDGSYFVMHKVELLHNGLFPETGSFHCIIDCHVAIVHPGVQELIEYLGLLLGDPWSLDLALVLGGHVTNLLGLDHSVEASLGCLEV
jgi:hypothetical protein